MTKRSCIIGAVLSAIGAIGLFIASGFLFKGNDYAGYILLAFAFGLIIAIVRFIEDFRYLTGRLTYEQFKKRSEYEYWFYTYGNKAYEYYLTEIHKIIP